MWKCRGQSYKAVFYELWFLMILAGSAHIQLELLRHRRPGSKQSTNPSKYLGAFTWAWRGASWEGAALILNSSAASAVPDRLNRSQRSSPHKSSECHFDSGLRTEDCSMPCFSTVCHKAPLPASSNLMDVQVKSRWTWEQREKQVMCRIRDAGIYFKDNISGDLNCRAKHDYTPLLLNSKTK